MSTERTITLRKRMAASKCKDKEGREVQFLGSGYINRWKNGKGCEERDRADTWSVKGSECYLASWCDQAYFEQIPVTPEPFPVWATVKRVQPENVVSSEKNL